MKKTWLAAPMLALLLGACGGEAASEAFDEMMAEGEKTVREGDYDKAIQTFENAEEENPKQTDAKDYARWTEELKQMNGLAADGQWDESLAKADRLLETDGLPGLFQAETERFKRETVTARDSTGSLERRLDQAGELADAGDPQQAVQVLDDVLSSDEWNEYGRTLKTKAEDVQNRIDASEKTRLADAAEQDRLAKAEAEEQKQLAAAEAKKKEEAAAREKQQASASTQTLYLQKLDAIEAGLSDLDHLYTEGLPEKMIQGEEERYRRWDAALNEIYGVLKKQLSTGEMESLRQKQRNWITYRDHEADTARAEGVGAVGERNYHGTLAHETQKRCYELVRGYMK